MKIIEIIKRFFRNLKSNKTKMIEEKTTSTSSYNNKREAFAKSIYLNEKVELDMLQRKLEKNEISVSSLNIFEVMDLIDRYQNQITELKKST